MLRRFCLSLLFLFNVQYIVGQNAAPVEQHTRIKATFYYTINWELTTPEKSFYKRIANFDLDDMVFDGLYKDYSKDDRLIGEGLYAHGEKRGFQTEYFNDRTLKSTMEFTGHNFTIWELHSENGEALVKGGTGTFTLFYVYVSGLVSQPVMKQGILQGEFQRGRRAGTWIYQNTNRTTTDEELYDHGKLIKRIHYAESQREELDYPKDIIVSVNTMFTDSFAFDRSAFTSLHDVFQKTLVYPANFSRTITAPGGIKSLLRQISANTDIPEGDVLVVGVKIDAAGKALKYTVDNVYDVQLQQRALNAVKSMEARLLPGIHNGKAYKSMIYLPVSGGQQWTDIVNQASVSDLIQTQTKGVSISNVLGILVAVLLIVVAVI